MRRKIRLNFEDVWFDDYRKSVPMSYFIELLSKIVDVEFSESPDYLICSCFGNKAVLSDCCKIFFAGENVIPDFNIYDYGIGFSNIEFGDRYLRAPLYFFYHDDFVKAINKNNYGLRTKFCNMVVSNSGIADDQRTKFFHELSKYKHVDSGGRYLNNVGGPVKDKYEFQRQYKFSIAFENSAFPGYVTEKITQAWAAGTIPIYWGNPDIEKEFNNNAFINANGIPIEDVVKKVIEIDQSEELFERMRRAPIFNKDNELNVNKYINEEYVLDFFRNIFYQSEPKRVSKFGSSQIYIGRIKERAKFEYSNLGQSIIKVKKIIKL